MDIKVQQLLLMLDEFLPDDSVIRKASVYKSLQKELDEFLHLTDIPIYDLEEAKEWFLSNSSGSVVCYKDGNISKRCDSFSEAIEFYNNKT